MNTNKESTRARRQAKRAAERPVAKDKYADKRGQIDAKRLRALAEHFESEEKTLRAGCEEARRG